MGDSALTGVTLAGLASAYVAAVNAGAVPTIATAWQSVVQQQCGRAAEAAAAAYQAAWDGDVAADDHALAAAHRTVRCSPVPPWTGNDLHATVHSCYMQRSETLVTRVVHNRSRL